MGPKIRARSAVTAPDGRLIISGKRQATSETIISKSPATLEPIGEASLAAQAQCAEAISAAAGAFPAWRGLPLADKKKIFHSARRILLDRKSEAARLISLEKGSPITESMIVEVLGSLNALDYYSHHLEKSFRSQRVRPSVPLFAHKKSAFHFQPLGPTLVISPWNFPFLIPLYDVTAAMVAGNTVVLRPSTSTPLIALFLGEIFAEAGLPPGVLNVVPCRAAQAEEMITNPKIQTVMFTGSVPIGKRVMELASRNLTTVVLELGGKDPMVVLRDADIEKAARGAVWTGFMNCGQSCASIERVYVAREIAEKFIARVVDLTRELKVGNPLDPDIDMGPMTTLGQLQTVEDHIRDAREKGAEVLAGGERIQNLPGYFIAPTVLTRVNHTMKVMTEETFGPVLPIMTFSGVDEAIALANDCAYGLTASVWTRDRRSAAALAAKLEAGTVTINDHMYSFTEPRAIWGGIKQTGTARSHGPYGLLHLQNIKFVSSEFLSKKTPLWWFPYARPKLAIVEKALILLHDGRFRTKLRALASLLPFLKTVGRAVPISGVLRISARLFRK